MEAILYNASLVIIAVTCLIGVFARAFVDNLVQRIGFSMACLGAVVRLLESISQSPNETAARYLFTYGVATYCIGTVFKLWRKTL